jgi:hypothetical protein
MNKEYMKKITLALMTCLISNSAFALSDVIQKWDNQVAEKGYILSLDLLNNKKCSKIWTNQIKAFLRENPHVMDANLILVNEKIKVQDCKIQIEEAPKQVESAPVVEPVQVVKAQDFLSEPNWFVGVFGGLSKLGGRSDDTAKEGSSLGIKVGQVIPLTKYQKLSWALGFMENNSETTDSNNILGAYEVKSRMFTGEAEYLFSVWKLALGPKAMIVAGDDTSFREQGDKKPLGLYLGAALLAPITQSLDFEVDFQQRAEDRLNILGNIGLRFNF